jgi:hypothetical protein
MDMENNYKWVKSTLSQNECVEVATPKDGSIKVRDSKNQNGAILSFTQAEWNAFLGGVKQGEFDLL